MSNINILKYCSHLLKKDEIKEEIKIMLKPLTEYIIEKISIYLYFFFFYILLTILIQIIIIILIIRYNKNK